MEKFKSQICTTREQSDRLLALGLKKETADMQLVYSDSFTDGVILLPCPPDEEGDIPAWSLHRLIEMGFNSLALLEDADDEDEIFFMAYKNPFESMLEMFEWIIKEGDFNKEYLV